MWIEDLSVHDSRPWQSILVIYKELIAFVAESQILGNIHNDIMQNRESWT